MFVNLCLEMTLRVNDQRQGADVDVSFPAVASAGSGFDGKRCINTAEMVEETGYDDVVQCNHSFGRRCHTTYTTNYESQQEEDCEENFRKCYFIEHEQIAFNETATVCRTPLVRDGDVQGPEICRTKYKSECWTQEVDDVVSCKTEIKEKCEDNTTGCTKEPRELCALAGGGFKKGAEECFNKVQTVAPKKPCSFEPKSTCKHVTKLVPELEPTEECVDVPKEVCTGSRKVKEPDAIHAKPLDSKLEGEKTTKEYTGNKMLTSLSRMRSSDNDTSSPSSVVGRGQELLVEGRDVLRNNVRVHGDQEHVKMRLEKPCKFWGKKLDQPSVLKRHMIAHTLSGGCAFTECESFHNGETMMEARRQGIHQAKQGPKVQSSCKNCGHHQTSRFKCVGCDAECNRNNSLKLHMARHQLSSSLILDSFLQMIQDFEERGQWRHERLMVRLASSTIKEVHSLDSLQQRQKTLEERVIQGVHARASLKEILSRRDPLPARGPTAKWLKDLDGP